MAASKTIAVDEEAYEKLRDKKREGETFSDVIDRLAGERSLLEFAGNASDEQTEELRQAIRDARDGVERSLDDTARRLSEDS